MRTANRQIFRIAPALLVLAIALLQPAPEAFADVSVQDKEVLAAVDKVAPTVEEIAKKLWDLSEVSLLEIKSSAKSPIPDIIKEPAGLPDDMRSYGTRSQLKATILKGEGDDSFGPHSHGHSHNY